MTAPDHDAARWGVGVPPGYKATNTTAPDQPPASGLRDRIRDAIHAIHPDCGAYDSADCAPCTTQAAAIRAALADEILTTIGGYPDNEAVRPKVEVGRFLNDAEWAARIARGDQ